MYLAVRRLDAWAKRRAVAMAFSALLAFCFVSPLWRTPLRLGHGDWLWFHFLWDVTRKSLVTFGEPLLWNPYYCGGNIGLANPQSLTFSPVLWLLAPLPTAVGMKAFVTLSVFLGAWGMWELCRRFYGTGLGAIFAATLFACSGTLGWHLNGQLSMANMQLYPWVFLCLLAGRERSSRGLLAGALLAGMFLGAGVYAAVLGGVAVAVLALATVVVEGRAGMPLLRSAALAAVALPAVAAVKLLPLIDVLRDHRRPIANDDSIPLWLVPRMLLERRTTETQIWPHEGFAYAWWGEYGNYVGPVGVAVIGAAIVYARGATRERLALAGCFALVLGDHGPLSPYRLLRSLPLMESFRVPTRYWVFVNLFAAAILSVSVQRAIRAISIRPAPRFRGIALAGLVTALSYLTFDLVRTNGIDVLRGAMVNPPAPPDEPFVAFRQVAGSAWPMTPYPPRNQGTLRCFDELRVTPSPALRAGLPSEVYLDDSEAGTAEIAAWTPNQIRIRALTTRPATVIYNQSFFRGWQAEGGTLVTPRGLVGASVGVGVSEVRLFYRPVGYRLGAAISLAALLLIAVWLRREAQGWTNTNVP